LHVNVGTSFVCACIRLDCACICLNCACVRLDCAGVRLRIQQGVIQFCVTLMSLGIGAVTGLLTGFALRSAECVDPMDDYFYEDAGIVLHLASNTNVDFACCSGQGGIITANHAPTTYYLTTDVHQAVGTFLTTTRRPPSSRMLSPARSMQSVTTSCATP
jgi:hypothetical protein